MATRQGMTLKGCTKTMPITKGKFGWILATEVPYQMRASFLAPILPPFMKEGESKEAVIILMKHSHFD